MLWRLCKHIIFSLPALTNLKKQPYLLIVFSTSCYPIPPLKHELVAPDGLLMFYVVCYGGYKLIFVTVKKVTQY